MIDFCKFFNENHSFPLIQQWESMISLSLLMKINDFLQFCYANQWFPLVFNENQWFPLVLLCESIFDFLKFFNENHWFHLV